MTELPRQLDDFIRAPGLIKQDYEDFVVEEVPLYEASGDGTHTYFVLEKRGLSTMQAVADLARALDVRRRDIGYAGLKDARAVSRQWMSIEHVEPDRIRALSITRLKILDVTQHGNKLRLGHLVGNRFTIKVRNTASERLAEFQDALAALVARGVPNYFGPQRFGARGDSWVVGRAIVRGDMDDALDTVLGKPSGRDHGAVLRARELYELQNYPHAMRAWPGMFRDERRALKALHRTGGKKRVAFLSIDASLRKFYVSAYQSYLFNQIVADRLETGIERLADGDLAWLHANGAVFAVEKADDEQSRADAFEISPSGPLYGYRMTEPTGVPGQREAEVLEAEGLKSGAFRSGALRVKGGRRALRFKPTNASIGVGADERGSYLELRFMLSRGCYATSLLRELFDEQWPVGGMNSTGNGPEDPSG